MRKFTPQRTAISFKLTLDTILAQIPGPGTKPFDVLCRELKRFGLTSAGIMLETPTTRLADVVIRIQLLDDRAVLSLSYSGFELFFDNMRDWDDVQTGGKIVTIVCQVLETLDRNPAEALSTIALRSHVRLVSNDLEFFLRENLGGIDVPHPNLLPEAFSYSFVWPDAPDTLNPRIVVARSYVYDEALFLDFSCDYRMSSEESSIHFDKNFTRALAELRLERADEAE